jgi:hypothetical protein
LATISALPLSARMSVPATPRPRVCDECPTGRCRFSVSKVYLYLIVMRQARLIGEPFDVVLRSRVRSSRSIDPGVRGPERDPHTLRAIGWALDEIETRHGISVANPHNAERVAALLCPERYTEGQE